MKIRKLATDTAIRIYSEIDPKKKDATWANLCIQRLRMDWRRIVNVVESQDNRSHLLGMQSMEKIKKTFKDKKFLDSTNWEAIDVMFNIRNTLTEDLLKSPPKAELKATDPTAMSDRDKDIQMLKSRKVIEGDISKFNKQVGLPPYKVPYDKFKGNVKDFDKMGLNENDSDDVSFYEMNFQRLDYEIAAQQVLNNVMKLNRFDEDSLRKFVIDILADNVVCMQTYVDRITGEIKYKYIYPVTARGIFNDSNDGHNDICKGWEDSMTIMEFLQLAGNSFDWKDDWPKLLWAINFYSNGKFTGFQRNGVAYNTTGNFPLAESAGLTGNEQSNLFDWSLAYTYKVWGGYIEWNTVEATATYVINKNNRNYVQPQSYDYELSHKEAADGYEKESYYQQQWYSSFYLATTLTSQWIFNFGKVYYQQLEGSNDEYSSGTLKYFMVEGQSAIQVAKPFIHFVNLTFYKVLWLTYHAKPEEDQVILEELISISKGMQRLYGQDAKKNHKTVESILTDLIKYQKENNVRLRSYPQIDGKTFPQLPPLDGKRNGLDNVASQMLQLMQWAEAQISNKIGINAMRLGSNPQSRESFKSEQATLESSLNTTGYIYRMIQFLKNRIATSTLLYAQDILKYKESIPYKWLKTLIGNDMFISLNVLNGVAAHRFGIFFNDYNSNADRQRVIQAADTALMQKMITLDGWAMVTQTEDFKLALKILSYLELKAAKKLRQQQVQDMQMQHQNKMEEMQAQMAILDKEGQVAITKANLAKQAIENSAQIGADSRVKVKEITVGSEGDKAAAKTQTNVETAYAKQNAEQQNSFAQPAGA